MFQRDRNESRGRSQLERKWRRVWAGSSGEVGSKKKKRNYPKKLKRVEEN